MHAILLVLAGILLGSTAWAQGGVSTTTGADPQRGEAKVDIGAGTTSATTTGSSGKSDSGGAKVAEAQDEPNRAPANGFQCHRIEDETARVRCEQRALEIGSPAELIDSLGD